MDVQGWLKEDPWGGVDMAGYTGHGGYEPSGFAGVGAPASEALQSFSASQTVSQQASQTASPVFTVSNVSGFGWREAAVLGAIVAAIWWASRR